MPDSDVRLDEAAEVDIKFLLDAAVQLLLATSDPVYSDLLSSDPKFASTFTREVKQAS